MDHSREILINGRFLTRPLTGVDRFALEVVRSLICVNRELGDEQRKISILVPPISAEQLALHTAALGPGVSITVVDGASGHLWEQLVLPRRTGRNWLLSLANVGPVAVRRQLVVMHDAQVWLYPQSYARAFRLWYRALLPALARRARLIFTVSKFSRATLESFGVVPAAKASVVVEGVDHLDRINADPHALSRFHLAPRAFFLALGSLAPHKNLATLVAAARARPEGAMPLIIAGGMNSKVFQATAMSDDKAVRFIGRVTDEELKALYENARALAFPSLTEGFGLPPVEAMYCGCPVIATTGGAVPEGCGSAALYVDPLDQDGWTQALVRLAEDQGACDALRVSGLENVQRLRWREAALILLRAIAREDDDAGLTRALDGVSAASA